MRIKPNCLDKKYFQIDIFIDVNVCFGLFYSLGLERAEDCYPCTGGYYCNGTGLTEPSGPCDPGYYCVLNATAPNPNDGITGMLYCTCILFAGAQSYSAFSTDC